MPDSFFKKGVFCWLLLISTFSYAQVAIPVEKTKSNISSVLHQTPTVNRQPISDSALLEL
jgi:hypothetical protein